MINQIEYLITILINDFLTKGYKTEITLNDNNINNQSNFNNNQATGNFIILPTLDNEENEITTRLVLPSSSSLTTSSTSSTLLTSSSTSSSLSSDKLYYAHLRGRQRFATFLYVLAEVHDLFLSRSHCTYRQLYYRNVNIEYCNTLQIQCAVNDVSSFLNTATWNLGIFAVGKCYIAGPLCVHMTNGDVIVCDAFKGPTLMPPNFTHIEKFSTSASVALVVEKDSVFHNLIVNGIFSFLNNNIILITARGYPDISTRWILHKLSVENHLNIYVLTDGDPFGIEIMLIYRYGSLRQSHLESSDLICPQLKWLGVHPSDISHLMVASEPLAINDYRKLNSLIRRFVDDEVIREELLILLRLKRKVKIDNISAEMFSLFISDYIVNKIKRQIVL